MRLLVINCGSSTLKFDLIDVDTRDASVRRLASGQVDKIGPEASVRVRHGGEEALAEQRALDDHEAAMRFVAAWLRDAGLATIDAVAHRVVHGGATFTAPVLADDSVVAEIEALTELAPLHNAPALAALRAARPLFADAAMVATFDTAFHRTLPPRAAGYAIPLELAERHGVRRYGFHGLAHRYMTERYVELTGAKADEVGIVTLQLGNGCSAAAVRGGRSIDTSMGLTPLEGLMMGTRSGDVDPSLAGYLARREGTGVDEIEDRLNTASGLLGVSGGSSDVRELLEAEAAGDERAALALEMFCYRVRKYVGAYLAALGGAEAVVFGGGIGEHAVSLRARICAGLRWCGLEIDPTQNAAAVGVERRISADGSALHAYVLPVDEALVIARDAHRCLVDAGWGQGS